MEENGGGTVAGVGGLFGSDARPDTDLSETVADEEDSEESEPDNDNGEESSTQNSTDTSEVTKEETEEETENKGGPDSEESSESESVTEEEPEPYYPAPDFVVYTADGDAVNLSDFKGKPVVINFWAKDCPYCVSEMPDFQKAYEKYGDEVVFMMICHLGFSNSTVAREQAFIDSKGYTFPVYYDVDGEAVTQYGIRGIPNTYFVKSNGGLYEYYIPGAANYTTLEECILGAMGK
jgi:peroxiredoxin